MTRPVVAILESGPASYAALRAAADIAARLGVPLHGYVLVPPGPLTTRWARRLRLAGRRRGVEVSLVRPPETDLLEVAASCPHALVVAVGRNPGRGRPTLGRRILLGRLLRLPGAPVLVVTRRGRPLGDRILLCSGDQRADLGSFYGIVRPLLRRLSILRFLPRGRSLGDDPGLDQCIGVALSWDERIVRTDDRDTFAEAVLAAADRMRPTLVAVGQIPEGLGISSVLCPGAADRAACESDLPVLVARVRPQAARVAA